MYNAYCPLRRLHRGVEQMVARRAHNPKVVGSSPASATNNANRKRYQLGKPGNHNGFCFFRIIFQGGIQKISFPKNDLWGGLELYTWAFRGRFCDYFRRVCPFFRFSNC